ncbi:MAG: 5-(carboxyamino)imidazole ribonucleotide synthase [Pseudomonadota bacterium]|nr:5-(carboxyamino)imidazole ribonucleotide synthase [Pseudomonadota bacterium]
MKADNIAMIKPGSVIGILGGGQLGRMISIAAARLGYRCHIFSDVADSPAGQVSDTVTVASYSNFETLEFFADSVDVVTMEFENIPEEPVSYLDQRTLVRPSPKVLSVAQDRLVEKNFMNSIGVETTPYVAIQTLSDLVDGVSKLGLPSVLKTTRFGYDGKGQSRLRDTSDIGGAFTKLREQQGILEQWVPFTLEISVIVARSSDGEIISYGPVENRHVNHILDTTIVPARISQGVASKAEKIARKVAEKLNLVGLLAVEMFVTSDGKVLVNEIAPRPHNSGHWTIDACKVCQFQQLIRAICGLPLGSPERLFDAEMKNLIGDDVNHWADSIINPDARLHLYGKSEIRSGRKMGHVTQLKPLTK